MTFKQYQERSTPTKCFGFGINITTFGCNRVRGSSHIFVKMYRYFAVRTAILMEISENRRSCARRSSASERRIYFSLKAFYKLSFREGMCGRRGRQHVPLVRSSSYCFIKNF